MTQNTEFVMTLISASNAKALSVALAEAIEAQIGSKHLYWLSDNEAADIILPFDCSPEQAREIAQIAIGELPIDIVIQTSDGRRKKLLLADMDSTMIDQECIDELAAELGFGQKVSQITAKAMNGEIEFDEALKERVALLAGLPVSKIQEVYQNRITLAAGGPTLLATMKARGCYSALVSGGFTHFTSRVAQALGFDENRANILLEDDGSLSGKVGTPILGADAKVTALEEITQKLGISESDAIAVGDGANDLPMLTRAGSGVALHAKPNVAAKAQIVVNHGDLTSLLFIQGYRKSDFVEDNNQD